MFRALLLLCLAFPTHAAIRGVPADDHNCRLVGAIAHAVATMAPKYTEAETRSVITAKLREHGALPSYVPDVLSIAWAASKGSPNTPPERARVALYQLCMEVGK